MFIFAKVSSMLIYPDLIGKPEVSYSLELVVDMQKKYVVIFSLPRILVFFRGNFYSCNRLTLCINVKGVITNKWLKQIS